MTNGIKCAMRNWRAWFHCDIAHWKSKTKINIKISQHNQKEREYLNFMIKIEWVFINESEKLIRTILIHHVCENEKKNESTIICVSLAQLAHTHRKNILRIVVSSFFYLNACEEIDFADNNKYSTVSIYSRSKIAAHCTWAQYYTSLRFVMQWIANVLLYVMSVHALYAPLNNL